jgi:hypothetical protein
MAAEFHELATHHSKRSVALDLECRNVSDTDLLFWVLVRLFREVIQVDGTLKLCNLSPPVLDAMSAIRLTGIFAICESLDDALAGSVLNPRHSET